jgi:tetratricopeptide (TPR) repeat protein
VTEGDAPAAGEPVDVLEETRDFLLRSLDDLEREHDAGDIDEADYLALRDDYTARAAAAIRAVDAARAGSQAAADATARAPSRPPSRRWVTVVAIVVVALLAGVLVAQASGRRGSGELGTGSIRETVRSRLAEARRTLEEGDASAAVAAYDEVLADEPANPEALTYRGWALFLGGGEPADGLLALIDAATAAPDYPDVHAFLAVAFDRLGRPESALAELDRMAALDPAPQLLELTAPLRARLEQQLATSTTAPSSG